MEFGDPHKDFRHTTLPTYPEDYDRIKKKYTPKRVGITLLDEKPGFTGIYIRDENGGLWPARTVSHEPPEHHESVCGAWMAQYEDCQDKRAKSTRRQ